MACVDNGQIYTSTDSDATWTAGASSQAWYGVASSSDGMKLVACVLGGYVYTGHLVLAPTVTTTAISNITDTTADSGGNVTSDGGDPVCARTSTSRFFSGRATQSERPRHPPDFRMCVCPDSR